MLGDCVGEAPKSLRFAVAEHGVARRVMRVSLATLSCEPGPSDAWSVVDLDVPGYAAAVAAAGPEWTTVVRGALSSP